MAKSNKKFISLKYDFSFKEIFRSEAVRRHFMSDVLEIPLEEIKSVRLGNPFLWKRYQKQKQGILDVYLIFKDGTKINVELQIQASKFWYQRSLFYLSKMYSDELLVGQDYSKLKKCIVVNILDFELEDTGRFHRKYVLQDKDGHTFGDFVEIHVIELKKDVSPEDRLKPWVELFNAETKEELEMIRTENKGVLEAREVLRTVSLSRNLRYLYEERLKEIRDRKAQDAYVYDQGHAAGQEDQLWNQIQRKLARGKEPAQIAEELETTVEEIELIIKKRQ